MSTPIRILIIDPDVGCRKFLTTALAHRDEYEFIEAGSEAEGLHLLQSNPNLSLILADPIDLRSQNLDLVSDIRSLNSTIPLVVVSTYTTSEGVTQAMHLGADDFLFKPVDLGDLRTAVQLLISVPRPRKGRRTAPRESSSNRMVMHHEGDGTFVELTAPTDSPHVDRFERFVRRLLEHMLSKDEYFSVRLALEETITNAIEWGNQNDASKELKLSYCLLHDRVTFRIEDQGEGFDLAAVPDPTVDPREHIKRRKASGKRMGGWGVCLTQKAVDEMEYNEKGNVVLLTKFLKSHQGSRTSSSRSSQRLPPATEETPSENSTE